MEAAVLEEKEEENNNNNNNKICIVFGGKYKKRDPDSISETLIPLLIKQYRNVYTVSRTNLDDDDDDVPDNLYHFTAQTLDAVSNNSDKDDSSNCGWMEYFKILERVEQQQQQKSNDLNSPMIEMDIYFTLGQHKGYDPFRRNIASAENLQKALLHYYKSSLSPTHQPSRKKLLKLEKLIVWNGCYQTTYIARCNHEGW